MTFSGKTVFITGGSRGIGKAIGLRLAKEGANIVIAAKTTEPHPKLEGTIYTAAEEIERAGGKALAVQCDIQQEEQVVNAVNAAVEKFGGIDIVVNNASAINLMPGAQLPLRKYDLMQDINTRGTYLVTRHCVPHLKRSSWPRVVVLSPPLSLDKKWFAHFAPYTISKFGMSMLVLGFSQELAADGIAVNGLWPCTFIATAAVKNLLGGDEMVRRSRSPEIVGDAAFHLFSKDSSVTGNLFTDEEVLRSAGITDFSAYNLGEEEPQKDIFL